MNSQRAIRDLNSCLDISSERIKPPPQGLKQHVGLFLAMRYKEMKFASPLRGACRWRPAMPYDLLVKNATVVDGTGAPRYRADIAITRCAGPVDYGGILY